MTPDQTEVIFEEYVEMNRVDDSSGDGQQIVSEGSFFNPKTVETAKTEGEPTLAERIRAELNEKTKKKEVKK